MQPITSILGPRNKGFDHPRKNPRITKVDKTQENTESLANYLVDKFSSPEFKPFFLKVAWRVDKNTVDRLVGTSFELGKNPRAYFITLIKKEKSFQE